MGGHYAEIATAAVEEDIERAARLVRWYAEIEARYGNHAMSREEHVPELGVPAQHRHAVHRLGAEALAKELQEVVAGSAGLHLLERDHVRAEFGQDLGYALGIKNAVPADRAVDVVGGHCGPGAGLTALHHSTAAGEHDSRGRSWCCLAPRAGGRDDGPSCTLHAHPLAAHGSYCHGA